MAQGYTVRKGDSWFRIAGMVYGDQRMAQELAKANGDISMLRPGQVLRLPGQKRDPRVTQTFMDTKGQQFEPTAEQISAGVYGGVNNNIVNAPTQAIASLDARPVGSSGPSTGGRTGGSAIAREAPEKPKQISLSSYKGVVNPMARAGSHNVYTPPKTNNVGQGGPTSAAALQAGRNAYFGQNTVPSAGTKVRGAPALPVGSPQAGYPTSPQVVPYNAAGLVNRYQNFQQAQATSPRPNTALPDTQIGQGRYIPQPHAYVPTPNYAVATQFNRTYPGQAPQGPITPNIPGYIGPAISNQQQAYLQNVNTPGIYAPLQNPYPLYAGNIQTPQRPTPYNGPLPDTQYGQTVRQAQMRNRDQVYGGTTLPDTLEGQSIQNRITNFMMHYPVPRSSTLDTPSLPDLGYDGGGGYEPYKFSKWGYGGGSTARPETFLWGLVNWRF